MEKDAQDWVKIVGNQNYWATYKETMREAGFNKGVLRPLYVACGLLKSGQQDEWSRLEMGNIERDILVQKVRCSDVVLILELDIIWDTLIQ